MSGHCLGVESQRDGNNSKRSRLNFVESLKGPRAMGEAISTKGKRNKSFYDVYGRSSIKNVIFNNELIVLDLNEEWVYYIGFSFLCERNAREMKEERRGPRLGKLGGEIRKGLDHTIPLVRTFPNIVNIIHPRDMRGQVVDYKSKRGSRSLPHISSGGRREIRGLRKGLVLSLCGGSDPVRR
jgi:hypothetical protein